MAFTAVTPFASLANCQDAAGVIANGADAAGALGVDRAAGSSGAAGSAMPCRATVASSPAHAAKTDRADPLGVVVGR